jgi:putative transposase
MYTGLGKLSIQSEKWRSGVVMFLNVKFCYEIQHFCLVRNRKLAKSINDAGWTQLRKWIEYFGIKYGRLTIAINPAYTSQECLNCGRLVKKSLSVRTHVCLCGYVEDRDKMAALNILKKATIGHIGSWSSDLNAWGDLSSILVGSNTCQDNLSQ